MSIVRDSPPTPEGTQFKVVCVWCVVVIRLRERKDSEGMCDGCSRRLLNRHIRNRLRKDSEKK